MVRGGQRQSMINDELRNKLHMQYAALRRYNASIESDGYVTAHQTNDGGHLTWERRLSAKTMMHARSTNTNARE